MDYSIGLAISLGFLLLFLITKRDKIQLPGPARNSIFGVFFQLIKHRREETIHLLFNEWSKYGNLVKIPTYFYSSFILVNDAEIGREVLTSSKFVRGKEFQNTLVDLMPFALFLLPSGEQWKRHRKMLQPAFAPVHLRHAFQASVDSIKPLIDYLKSGPTINAHEAINSVALDILGHVAFSYDFQVVKSFISGEEYSAKKLAGYITDIAVRRFGTPQILWWMVDSPKNCSKILQIKNFFKPKINDIIEKRKSSGDDSNSFLQIDLLQRLLKDNQMNDDEIFGEILGFILAGHETTANAVTSAIYELSRNPDIQERLYKEVKDIEPTMEAIQSISYLDWVIKETLRLHAVVQGLRRQSTNVAEFDGIVFPAKTVFRVAIGAIHTNPRYWENPQEFNPQRFSKPIIPGSFMPFGDGPTNCIGQKMAIIESKVMLYYLVKEFKMHFVPQQIKFKFSVTYGLKDGLEIRFEPRN